MGNMFETDPKNGMAEVAGTGAKEYQTDHGIHITDILAVDTLAPVEISRISVQEKPVWRRRLALQLW